MAQPVTVDLPHTLGREEAIRRMHARTGSIGSFVPGGLAKVKTSWPREDRMALEVEAFGQTITGTADAGDSTVRLTLELPGMLAMMAGPIAASIRDKGSKMLLGDDSKA